MGRYHNGSLLELNSDSTLVLRNLRMEQAGEYYCRASNQAGAIKSKPATLTVLGLLPEHSMAPSYCSEGKTLETNKCIFTMSP